MTEDKKNSYLYICLLFFIVLFAIVSRLYGIDRLSLWSDELWVVIESTRYSLAGLLNYIYYNDNHPPGYYFLSRYAQYFLGSSDTAIRLPSALAGIALVYAVYRVGCKQFSREAGLIAAALMAGSFQGIYYSQEARANIFLALFSLLSFYYFYALVTIKKTTAKNYLGFYLTASACFYLHYSGLVFVACLGLFYLMLLLKIRDTVFFINGLKIFLPVFVLCAPWFFGMYQHMMHSPMESWMEIPPGFRDVVQTFHFLLGPDSLRYYFYVVVLFCVVMRLLVDLSKRVLFEKNIASWLAIWLIILPIAIFFVKSILSQPAYSDRHFLVVIPLAALLTGNFLSRGITTLKAKNTSVLLCAVVILILVFSAVCNSMKGLYTWPFAKEEYREATEVVAKDNRFLSAAEPKAIVINNLFFQHYLKRDHIDFIENFIFNDAEQRAALKAFVEKNKIEEFYYLEDRSPRFYGKNIPTKTTLALLNEYQALCRQQFIYAQSIKFRVMNETKKSAFAVSAIDAIRPCLPSP